MLYIAIFMFGILFGLIGIPKITCLSEEIYNSWEVKKSGTNIKIAQNNVVVSKLNEQLEKNHTTAIGFQTYDEQEEYYEEDKKKSNRKVGF